MFSAGGERRNGEEDAGWQSKVRMCRRELECGSLRRPTRLTAGVESEWVEPNNAFVVVF